MRAAIAALVLISVILRAPGAEWIRAGLNTNQPVWGIRGGLEFAIHPGGFRGAVGGPRGLIRLGFPILTNGGYDLVNFIAVEPVVAGRKGFSELEKSTLDGVAGKRFWIDPPPGALAPGTLTVGADGAERLELVMRVEKFDNGAHVRVVIRQRAESPEEIELAVHAEPDSAPMDYCILTATMGNMARTRELWLKDKTVSSLQLYPSYRESAFAPHTRYGLDQLWITPSGELLAAVTNDETDPSSVRPFSNFNSWRYAGVKVTQYWKKLSGTWRPDIEAVVNARFTYWQSKQPIPGGIAFENFELRERFRDGQSSIFGITRRTPRELGFSQRQAN